MTRLALKFLCWTLKTFNVYWILHTSDISPCSCTHSWHQSPSSNYCFGMKVLVACYLYHSCDFGGLGFTKDFLFLCLLAGRSVCWCHIRLIAATWGSLATLLDMPGSHLRTLHLLCKLPDLACRKFVQVYAAVIDCLGDKLFIFKEEPKDVPMKFLGSFWGVLSQSNLGPYCIVPFINWLVSLLEACEKIKPSPHSITLWLA